MVCLVLLLLISPLVSAAPEVSLQSLRAGHPRLIALDSDIVRARGLVKSDARARSAYERLRVEAEKILAEPPVEYRLIGPRLLDKSRRALGRIYTLALLYRLDGEKKHLDRAVVEMRAAADFKDWNPSHFLDTAEMTHAFAIGYDWLYPALTEEQRGWIRAAIAEKGLDQAMPIYEAKRWWVVATHNWNQVCNGGIGLGALAIAESAPEKALRILKYAVESIPRGMNSYGPDGGWNEGPGYWDYATRYSVYFLAGLETALGTDYDLAKIQGFDRAGHFRIDFSGPSGRTFNYADAGDGLGPSECSLWLAQRFKQPVYAWQELDLMEKRKRVHSLDLVWWPDTVQSPQEAKWPLDSVYQGVQTAFMRGSWSDPDTIWIGVKGGDNKANHSHVDLGTFVMDALGERWFFDLGSDDYNLPAYFGNKRWTYYRLRTESHNTVLIDNENQDPKSAAKLLEFSSKPEEARVSFDLAETYPGRLAKHQRTVRLIGRRTMRILDELAAPRPVDMLWGAVTDAQVTLDGSSATLTKNGKSVRARILRAPDGARFEVVSTQPEPPQRQNEGTRKLVVRLPAKVTQASIEVAVEPAHP